MAEDVQGSGDPHSVEQPTATERFRREVEARQGVADDEERDIWAGGYSPKAMIDIWVLCGLVTIAALATAAVLLRSANGWMWLIGGLIVLWLVPLTVLGYRRLAISYRLTTQQLFHEFGVLRRRTDRIELIDMDDISFDQRLVERFIGCGTINIDSSDKTHPQFVMKGIENVREIAGQIDHARRTERRRRGLHIEAV